MVSNRTLGESESVLIVTEEARYTRENVEVIGELTAGDAGSGRRTGAGGERTVLITDLSIISG